MRTTIELTPEQTEQLCQLVGLIWDGDLLSKQARNQLVAKGLAVCSCGWNVVTPKGVRLLAKKGLLKP